MKVGDLVQHNPGGSSARVVKDLYKDWGHEADFKAGIIILMRDNFAQVMPARPNQKPVWYQREELKILSKIP